jgi:hypothetical protein
MYITYVLFNVFTLAQFCPSFNGMEVRICKLFQLWIWIFLFTKKSGAFSFPNKENGGNSLARSPKHMRQPLYYVCIFIFICSDWDQLRPASVWDEYIPAAGRRKTTTTDEEEDGDEDEDQEPFPVSSFSSSFCSTNQN